MKATYRISEQDYVNAMKLFARLTPRIKTAYLLSASGLAALVVFGGPFWSWGALGGLIGGLATVLIVRYLVMPVMARHHYRKYKAIHEEFAIELIEDGVRFSSPDAEGKVTWDKMLKWKQNENYILIYPMPRLFHIIPRTVAAKGFDLQALTDGLLRHVGKPE